MNISNLKTEENYKELAQLLLDRGFAFLSYLNETDVDSYTGYEIESIDKNNLVMSSRQNEDNNSKVFTVKVSLTDCKATVVERESTKTIIPGIYHMEDFTKVTEYELNKGNLIITTGSLVQSANEFDFGGLDRMIVPIESIENIKNSDIGNVSPEIVQKTYKRTKLSTLIDGIPLDYSDRNKVREKRI